MKKSIDKLRIRNYNEEKEIFIEGSGLNKKLRNVNGLNNYVLTVNCENYQILT